MAILRGFPPSNTITPGRIWYCVCKICNEEIKYEDRDETDLRKDETLNPVLVHNHCWEQLVKDMKSLGKEPQYTYEDKTFKNS